MTFKNLTDLGEIIITEKAMEQIVGYATTHCYGVVGMCEKNKTEFFKKVFGGENLRQGIKCTINSDEISIDVHIRVSYGVNIKALCENVKQDITYAVASMTPIKIKAINVCVDDIIVTK